MWIRTRPPHAIRTPQPNRVSAGSQELCARAASGIGSPIAKEQVSDNGTLRSQHTDCFRSCLETPMRSAYGCHKLTLTQTVSLPMVVCMNPMQLAGLGIALLASGTLSAQSSISNQSIKIGHVEGVVYVDGHSASDSSRIRDNSVLRTDRGRAKISLTKSVVLLLGQESSFRTIINRLGDIRIEMISGSGFVATSVPEQLSVTISCEDVVTPSNESVLRFDANPTWAAGHNVCRLKVYRGSADVRLASLNTSVASGRMMDLSRECADMIPINDFNINDADRLNERTGFFRSGWTLRAQQASQR